MHPLPCIIREEEPGSVVHHPLRSSMRMRCIARLVAFQFFAAEENAREKNLHRLL